MSAYLHLRDNAELSGHLLHPTAFLEFIGSQFGVIGPLFFAGLIAIAARPRALAEPRARLLAAFALPPLALMLAISLLSRAEPNWAAPAYVSAIVLVVSLGAGARLAALGAGIDRAQPDGGGHSVRHDRRSRRWSGWRCRQNTIRCTACAAGASLAKASRPSSRRIPACTLLADDRELLAALIYYVHPHPFDAVEWNPVPGITDQWRLTNNIGDHRGEDFLAVTVHGLVDEMRPDFAELTPLATIATCSGPGGGTVYTVYLARGFRGSGRRHR